MDPFARRKEYGTGNVVAKAIHTVTNLLAVFAVVRRRTLLVAKIFKALSEKKMQLRIDCN